MRDRRTIERFEMKLPAVLRVIGENAGKSEILTETKDISSQGAYVVTDVLLPRDSQIEIEFDLSISKLVEMLGDSGHVRVKVEGMVARTDDNGLAVRFSRDYKIQALES